MPSSDAAGAALAAPPPPRAAISHVIFDMDGLLLGIFSTLLPSPVSCSPEGSSLVFFSQSHDEFSDADTEGFYTAVQEKILARYGKVFDWSVKAKMMGKTTAESTRILFEECGLTGLLTPEQFLEEREIMLKELLPTCVPMPGEEDCLSQIMLNPFGMVT
jgi:pseudouridine-5'-monophosphatase